MNPITFASHRLIPSQILNFEYSDIAFCGYNSDGNELYEKLDVATHEELPSLIEIAALSSEELIHLAHRIADAYRFFLLAATDNEKKALITSELEYKIKIKPSKNATTNSLSLRVSDRKWWRRQIIKLADETREHIAQSRKILGGKNPTQICCSDATVQMYRERKEKTDAYLKTQYKMVRTEGEDPFVFNLHEVSECSKSNRLNEIFLDIKALERIAEKNDFGCVFITLTAAANFHSNPKVGKDRYDGSTAREANKALQKDWRSIQDSLDNKNIKRNSGEYFGFRVAELHEDGCPHWHILFFYKKESEILETVLNSIERLYEDRSTYFDHHKSEIVRIIEKKDGSTATPSSYIFKYIAFALAGDNDELAFKYKCAIRSMGARQYSFFGIKCSLGKQRALKRIAKNETAPKKIKELARELHRKRSINPTDFKVGAQLEDAQMHPAWA